MMDAEVISIPVNFYKMLGLKGIKVHLNSLGDNESRNNYREVLVKHFSSHVDELCEDCKMRLEKNPLRILDCKVDRDKEFFKTAPKINQYLNDYSKDRFKKVLDGLDTLGLNYVIDDNLVRGLDYYTDTVFEFVYKSSDNEESLALGGGGRYANLIKDMCGVDVSGMGYASSPFKTFSKYNFDSSLK